MAAPAFKRVWRRINWLEVGKKVGEGAASAVGAIIVYGLAIFIVFKTVTSSSSSERSGTTASGALSKAIEVRTGGLIAPQAQSHDAGFSGFEPAWGGQPAAPSPTALWR